MNLVQVPPMPKSDKPKRDDKAVKVERWIAVQAKVIAESRSIPIAEYLSALLAPHIRRDWPGAVKRLGSSERHPEAE
jgi:hypothetical protein